MEFLLFYFLFFIYLLNIKQTVLLHRLSSQRENVGIFYFFRFFLIFSHGKKENSFFYLRDVFYILWKFFILMWFSFLKTFFLCFIYPQHFLYASQPRQYFFFLYHIIIGKRENYFNPFSKRRVKLNTKKTCFFLRRTRTNKFFFSLLSQ